MVFFLQVTKGAAEELRERCLMALAIVLTVVANPT